MVGKINMAAFFIVLAANLLQTTYGATYTVGDSTGWTIPTGNTEFYDNWADNTNFAVGDVLVFNFTTGRHDVAEVTEAAYDACNAASPISTLSTGPARVTLNRTGDYHFICAFPSHCSAGQKLSIEVRNSTAPTPRQNPSPTPTTPATPGTPTAAAPGPSSVPGANSASSLVANLSPVFLMSVALALLC
ncbi:hypothetical protein HRI_002095700 [Hibiscus trionum]|uniref:Phytocyanin domain-containing protein n=1 Tax=Hibiscus trionum TaxID=183268 RepID=A0A9W7HVA2_HIBTR|nr:hypothetical protein HRI_002095700 [Hibiscus trionum]